MVVVVLDVVLDVVVLVVVLDVVVLLVVLVVSGTVVVDEVVADEVAGVVVADVPAGTVPFDDEVVSAGSVTRPVAAGTSPSSASLDGSVAEQPARSQRTAPTSAVRHVVIPPRRYRRDLAPWSRAGVTTRSPRTAHRHPST
ncbi:MAG: hypothetical protein CL424_04670 [Acidimicrobiaceae bacterium]|nr:hypothetical protein [Acidimicrobiaceae bacterium]